MYVKKVAVVGAGTMGADIAYNFAMANIPVVLRDVDSKILDKAQEHIRALMQGRVAKGRLSAADMEKRLAQVQFSTQDEALLDVSLAIEAVPESLRLKQEVFRELDRLLPPLAILASNTSALAITEMANVTTRPERVAGMHFFYPAHTMKLVEIIAGDETDPEATATLVRLSEELRKIPVLVQECPGFVVNRILMAALTEVLRFKQENHLSPQDIDRVVTARKLAPMGLFVLADALGLDIAWEVSQILEKAYGDRFNPGTELGELVRQHHLGIKTGQGFYPYQSPPSNAIPNSTPMSPEQQEELANRFSLAIFCEATRLWEEGRANQKSIDIAMRAGAGLPMGPFAAADKAGLDVVYDNLKEMSQQFGSRFAPPTSLAQLVSRGQLGEKSGRGYFHYKM